MLEPGDAREFELDRGGRGEELAERAQVTA